MNIRGLGWRDDTPANDPPLGAAFGGILRPRLALATPDHRPWRGRRIMQRSASACVAFAIARAIHTSLRLQGHSADTPIPSPAFTYNVGRRQEWAGLPPSKIPPLVDDGTRPRLGMEATRKLGFVPWDALPYDAAKVNDPLPPDVFREAFDQRHLDYFRVYDVREARVEAVKRALYAGFPVIFGMRVDRAFMAHEGSDPVLWVNNEEVVGGHMMSVLAVDDHGVLVDNWWDNDWGFDDGFAYLTHDLFGSLYVSDVYAIRAAPLYDGAP